MALIERDKIHCINSNTDLEKLKSIYAKEICCNLDKSFEKEAVKSMYEYKFLQEFDINSLSLKLNPYLVFFVNRITNENLPLYNGLCVMYPSTLATTKIISHVKFVRDYGIILYALHKQNKQYYSIDNIISTALSCKINIDNKKIKRIIELFITDMFLIIEKKKDC